MPAPRVTGPHWQAAHWGTYQVGTNGSEITEVTPWSGDQDPSPLLGNLPGSVTHRSRVAGPSVRRGWWEDGPGPDPRRGTGRPGGSGPGDYLRVTWPELIDRLADELRRVVDTHGNAAVFGGSYGWASAGRFHHAQSQVHRFLNVLGGYTGSVDTYSTGALEVFLPRVACTEITATQDSVPYEQIVEHTRLWVAFGGVPVKNTGTNDGGTGDHPTRSALAGFLSAGGRLVGITPIGDDLPTGPGRVGRISTRPGSDTALILALCHTLLAEDLYDRAFVAGHTVGLDELSAGLHGEQDGVVKDADWAAPICGVPATTIRGLARDMAATRTLVTATWSLQRQEHGEMAIWAVVALGALLGQIGLPGGGFGFGYGSMNKPGLVGTPFRLPSLPQGANPVATRIPVASISELLLHPGRPIPYAGGTVVPPRIRLVYWAGGNPFHHHQDLNRLRRAFARPDTVVVHDPYWTATARHADIVIPSTTSAERADLTGSRHGGLLVAMAAAVPPFADARDDYDVFSALAEALGRGEQFTEGRSSAEWQRCLYEQWREDLAAGRVVDAGALDEGAIAAAGLSRTPDGRGLVVPGYDEFRARGVLRLPTGPPPALLTRWRDDPESFPLPTPSGRIELASTAIARLGLPDCPGLPSWLPPSEWAQDDRYPLHLIANQPASRLHSQLDHGATSRSSKVAGREPIRLHPEDAATRGILAGDLVRVFNGRGHCLAGAVLDDGLRPGVAQLATGAWYDPFSPDPATGQEDPRALAALDVHGNPNVLTADRGTSSMSQGCTGQWTMVDVERYDGPSRPVQAHAPMC
ncbi:biotin/methionine sulfoxide reductase [Austwickia chelonae]|uniref:Putative biotin sulfoxide reductase n=1 Tax=Austwickia chelonae NBRC 105200 TaxID=1184607 RepID=K6VQK6_9MICO|nr:molybdopterin-dependent oxidoreductase [Austwickia chelonae]GAB78989.1 putative biotin sulfoxide reductase [Austwickia chelonae NBRC 105200]SEV87882.1 biotin/methionine sulfoxide reductase [Austwickia chelonae]